MTFKVSTVNISTDENDIICISFLENTDSGKYLIIQYTDELDEQDIELGWTNYYIEISNLGGSYSCIKSVNWTKDLIEFQFNEIGFKKFHEEQIKIPFDVTSIEWTELNKALSKIFSFVPSESPARDTEGKDSSEPKM